MRVFVPGGTGFVGARLREELLALGYEVLVGGRSPLADVQLDVTSVGIPQLSALLDSIRPDVIVNLVGTGLSASCVDPDQLQTINAGWPTVLSEYLRTHEGPTIIHAASSTEKQRDSNDNFESKYSESKAAGTARLLELRTMDPTRIAVVYLHNIYGPTQPRERLVRWLINQAQCEEEVVLMHPNRVRDFVHIDDAARALGACVARPELAHLKEIGTGMGTSLSEVAQMIYTYMGCDTSLVRAPAVKAEDAFSWTVAQPDTLIESPTIQLSEGIRMTLRDLGELHS